MKQKGYIKYYELSNHLKSDQVVVSDKRLGQDTDNDGTVDFYFADVVSAQDLYPFGSVMPGRSYTAPDGNYSYGFNGMLKEDDITAMEGKGNHLDFGARIYDSRLGRFFSIDPKSKIYPYWSPYAFAGNNPIRFLDVYGEGPGDPMHHEFLTNVAIEIYTFMKVKGASTKGALLVISQASLESGWGAKAIKEGDYNLFGTMTNGTDYKRTTSAGNVRDYSESGGYSGSISDFYSGITRKWSTYAELLEVENFNADDIDQALFTGKYAEYDEERNKTGNYSYNADNIDYENEINTNQYGTDLITQMKSVKKRLIGSLNFQIDQNDKKLGAMKQKLMSLILTEDSRKNIINKYVKLLTENNKLKDVKNEISKVEI